MKTSSPDPAPYTRALAALDLPDWLRWTVKVSTRRRNSVDAGTNPDGSVTLTVPAGCTPDAAVRAFRGLRFRIIKMAEEQRVSGVRIIPKELVNGEGFPWLGRNQRLRLVGDDNRSGDPDRPLTQHPGVPIIAECGPSGWSGHRSWQLTMRHDHASARTIIEWYRAEGQRWLDEQIPPLMARLDVPPGLTWSVRPYRRGEGITGSWGRYRWPAHTITVDWRIFQFPRERAAYVVAHEVAHAALGGIHERARAGGRRLSHGPRWQAKVSALVPNWRELDRPTRSAAGLTLWTGEITEPTARMVGAGECPGCGSPAGAPGGMPSVVCVECGMRVPMRQELAPPPGPYQYPPVTVATPAGPVTYRPGVDPFPAPDAAAVGEQLALFDGMAGAR